MPLWSQHLLVLAVVAGCVAAVVIQGLRAFRGKSGGIGNCCSKGCPPKPASRPGERVAFMPVEMLSRKR